METAQSEAQAGSALEDLRHLRSPVPLAAQVGGLLVGGTPLLETLQTQPEYGSRSG